MPRNRQAVSAAVSALELPQPLDRKLSTYLDRMLCGPRMDRANARRAVHAAAAALLLRGVPAGDVVRQLQSVVNAHATERGYVHLALVSGVPRHAYLATEVAHWAFLTCVQQQPKGTAYPRPFRRRGVQITGPLAAQDPALPLERQAEVSRQARPAESSPPR